VGKSTTLLPQSRQLLQLDTAACVPHSLTVSDTTQHVHYETTQLFLASISPVTPASPTVSARGSINDGRVGSESSKITCYVLYNLGIRLAYNLVILVHV